MGNAYETKCEKCGRSVAEGAALRRVNPKGQSPFKGVCMGGCPARRERPGASPVTRITIKGL